MKQRFLSSPAHSCTPTMPKMKKTKKHSASTLPSMGSVSRRRVTRIRIPTNTHKHTHTDTIVLCTRHYRLVKTCTKAKTLMSVTGSVGQTEKSFNAFFTKLELCN